MKSRSEFLEAFKQVLDQSISDPQLNGEQLAAALGMSRMHLHRHLQRYVGCSAREAILRERIKRARVLLMQEKYTVVSIATMLGFSDPAYFSRVFRQVCGLSPLQYRQQEEE